MGTDIHYYTANLSKLQDYLNCQDTIREKELVAAVKAEFIRSGLYEDEPAFLAQVLSAIEHDVSRIVHKGTVCREPAPETTRPKILQDESEPADYSIVYTLKVLLTNPKPNEVTGTTRQHRFARLLQIVSAEPAFDPQSKTYLEFITNGRSFGDCPQNHYVFYSYLYNHELDQLCDSLLGISYGKRSRFDEISGPIFQRKGVLDIFLEKVENGDDLFTKAM